MSSFDSYMSGWVNQVGLTGTVMADLEKHANLQIVVHFLIMPAISFISKKKACVRKIYKI